MNGLVTDCRHALRLYVRTPGTSLIAVIVLATGMAFVVAFLSLYVDLALRPEPGFEQSGQIATAGQNGGPRLFGLPIAIVDRMADEMTSIDAVATVFDANVLIGPEREASVTTLVSAQFFDGLKPRLALGRGIRPEENTPDAEALVVISYRLWQDRFQGDPNVLGTVLDFTRDSSAPGLEIIPYRIVGVMAESLPGLVGVDTDSWIALERALASFWGPPENRPLLSAPTFVRKRPGVSAAAVASELTTRYSDYEFLASNYYPGVRLDAIDGIVDDITVKRDAQRQLGIFLAGSVLLALVAAANVSLFLLARAPGRRRELGVRLSVGAPYGRIARQLATEAGLLVIVAASLGLLISSWLSSYLRTLSILREAQWRDVSLLDWRVLGLAGVSVLVLTLLVSLTPLPGVRRMGIGAASAQTSARASTLQRLAGTGQIAVAGALGGAAIAFGWYLGGLLFGYPGYETADRHMVQFEQAAIPDDTNLSAVFLELARQRGIIESIPGVMAVGFGNPVPGANAAIVAPIRIDLPDNPALSVGAATGMLDAGFNDVLGLKLVHGRAPTRGDSFESGGSVVLVNQALARAVWGHDDVVGERLDNRLTGSWTNAEVIGVLADLSFDHPSAAAEPYVFLGAHRSMGNTAVIQTRMTAADLRSALEDAIADGSLETRIGAIRPLRAIHNEAIATDRARATLSIATATLVVLLAAFGYYSTQRYLVAAGRREYAIRASLGAGPGALGRLVLLRGLLLSLPGLALGALLAFIAVAWLRGDYLGGEISPALVTLSVVTGLIVLLSAASLGPAREARATHPAPLLRED